MSIYILHCPLCRSQVCQGISVDLAVSSGWVRPRSTEWSTFGLEVRKCSCVQPPTNCLCAVLSVFTSACNHVLGGNGQEWRVAGLATILHVWICRCSDCLDLMVAPVGLPPDPGVPAHVSSLT